MAKRARRRNGRAGKGSGRRAPPPPPPGFLSENWRALAIVLVIVLVVVGASYAVTHRGPDDGNGNNPPVANPAPDFSIQSIDGEVINLDMFRGRVVVLDLMATWCQPCVLQMEELNQLQAAYPESRVVILSIGVDTSETDQQLRTFKDQNHAVWRFASDSDDVGTKYDASQIPTLAIIDKEGNLAWRHVGVTTFPDLQTQVEKLL